MISILEDAFLAWEALAFLAALNYAPWGKLLYSITANWLKRETMFSLLS